MKKLVQLLALGFFFMSTQAYSIPPPKAGTVAFKCTAEDGTVSFLDAKPATGCVTVEVVNISDGTLANVQDVPEDIARAEAERAAKEKEEREAQVAKRCATAKRELGLLKDDQVIHVPDGKGGNRRLTEEERETKIAERKEYIDAICNPPKKKEVAKEKDNKKKEPTGFGFDVPID